MMTRKFVVFIFSLIFILIHSNNVNCDPKYFTDEEALELLPASNIDRMLDFRSKYNLTIVLLCVPKNQLCYDTYKDLMEVSRYFKNDKTKKFTTIDVKQFDTALKQFGISRLPYIIILTKDTFYPYLESYNTEAIINHLKNWKEPNIQSDLVHIDSTNLIKTFESAKDGTLVMLHHKSFPVSHIALSHYLTASKKIENDFGEKMLFVDASNDPAILNKINRSNFPAFGRLINKRLYFISLNSDKVCGKDIYEEYKLFHHLEDNVIGDNKKFESYLNEVLSEQYSCAIYYIKDVKSENFNNYKILKSNFWRRFNIIYTQDSEVATKNNCSVDKDCLLIFFPPELSSGYDKNHTIQLDHDTNYKSFVTTLQENSRPLVGYYSHTGPLSLPYSTEFVGNKSQVFVVMHDIDFSSVVVKETLYTWNKIVPIAKKYENSHIFAIADKKEMMNNYWGNYLNQDDLSEFQVLLVASDKYKFTYIMEESFSTDNLETFLEGQAKNALKPKLRSKPKPSKKYFGSTRILVGNTFRSVVLDNEKYDLVAVLVFSFKDSLSSYVYTGFNELAKKYQNDSNSNRFSYTGSSSVLFAMIDVDYNDFQLPLSIRINAPKIVLFSKTEYADASDELAARYSEEGKSYSIYSGDYTMESIEKFIHDNAPLKDNLEYKNKNDKLKINPDLFNYEL